MLKLYFLLFYEFNKIGLFAVGGGYATIPFLFYIQQKYQWFSVDELTDMIAVSNLTPGPVGINMATYTGFKTAGFTGAVISTLAIVLIPFIMTIILTKLITKFKNNSCVNCIFMGLRPASCALLASIGITLFYEAIVPGEFSGVYSLDIKMFVLFLLLIIPLSFFNKNPLLTIAAGAIGGIAFDMF